MLGFVFEVIFEVIFSFILMYPGALIRWICLGGKKSYKELIVDEDSEINTTVSMFFISITILTSYLIFK